MKQLCKRLITLSVMIGALLISLEGHGYPLNNTTEVYSYCGHEGDYCVGSNQGTCCYSLLCTDSQVCVSP